MVVPGSRVSSRRQVLQDLFRHPSTASCCSGSVANVLVELQEFLVATLCALDKRKLRIFCDGFDQVVQWGHGKLLSNVNGRNQLDVGRGGEIQFAFSGYCAWPKLKNSLGNAEDREAPDARPQPDEALG